MNGYDVIVVGAGHAGCEAAYATSKMGFKTALITLSLDKIALMPCNPSIGGPAKGIVVKEIEALGGLMGKIADKTALQFKMLNTSKGPGVQSLRVQSDKEAYGQAMKETLLAQENLTLIEAMATKLLVENGKIYGVALKDSEPLLSKIVILTTGTYLSAKIMISDETKAGGPDNLPTTNLISENLKALGISLFRLKTGTPPRLKTSTVDFSKTEIQPGNMPFKTFSYFSERAPFQQIPCYLTYTNQVTHDIINANIHKSSMYSGVVEGVGARYCPSIEDKLVRFSDKNRHQIFLEPETQAFDTVYVQGLSSSLPKEVQQQFVHSIAGLEKAEIIKYAYAIEYDAIDPLQTKASLENKLVENLFTAGQINGTSGYEEAAGQGLMAGINAALKLKGEKPFILGRDEAYIGVMIDDLVTKGTQEPYRLLTSRSEYRLLTRHDNSYRRLSHYGYQFGLVSQMQYEVIQAKINEINNLVAWCQQTIIKTNDDSVMDYLKTLPYQLQGKVTVYDLVKRPDVHLKELLPLFDYSVASDVIELAQIEIKYAGYIVKAQKSAEKLRQLEHVKLGADFDYDQVEHLANEARQKLKLIKPETLGQASRISGVNPADIVMLSIYLKKH